MSLIERIADDLGVDPDELRILPWVFLVAVIVITATLAMVWLLFAAFGGEYPA